jgi:hypothetical protein
MFCLLWGLAKKSFWLPNNVLFFTQSKKKNFIQFMSWSQKKLWAEAKLFHGRNPSFPRFFVKTYFFPLNELTLSNGHLKRIRFSLLIMT